ncbi:MAG: metal-dependent hydrolase [Deltaproteobacteria bacterium]|nr:metal-dependent hydrolase [Deltaproteobacteria bacterium]
MADITVRKIRFEFDERFDFDLEDQELGLTLSSMGLSLTMPHLEPYLIRTMKVALKEITDPVLAEDVRRFSQQEGHHFRNHADFNVKLRGHFEPDVGAELERIEAEMEADYQRFSQEKSLRWNAAYAEGFEAMTCSGALAMAEHGILEADATPGGELWPWHMAEEIEHRTVAFGVFEHLVGRYFYRVVFGARAQWHYLSYVRRFAKTMARGLGRELVSPRTPMTRAAGRNYLRTWSPRYDPAKIVIPPAVDALLARYSARAAS